MSKIELSEEQIALIKRYLAGEDLIYLEGEDQVIFGEVINKAEALMFELDAVEESGDDLIAWYWDKYQNQEQN
jgi:hypothetical protein